MAAFGRRLIAAAGGAFLWGCAAQPTDAVAPAAQQQGSILVSSSPAAGSSVSGPVNELMLHFNPPARLDEVTVDGPQGSMPMMVHAVGETEHYSLPLSDLGAGAYAVNWRATVQGREHRGSFEFKVAG